MKWQPASLDELQRRGLKIVRARKDDGKFHPDDPATPEVNEAWQAKPAPKRKRKVKE